MSDLDPSAAQEEIEADRRSERRLLPQAIVALAVVVVLVLVREWILR